VLFGMNETARASWQVERLAALLVHVFNGFGVFLAVADAAGS
jgi:hypothetical protein